jgi:1-deoxy-D-xylulose-5-phosphate reductoisomerase
MRVPIAHALAFPERWSSGVSGLDLVRLGSLRFQAPDLARFPCLKLARAAMEAGGGAPIALNAANEVAVEAFLQGRLGFTGIAALIGDVLEHIGVEVTRTPEGLDAILGLDAAARASAQAWLQREGRRVVNA